MKACGRVWIIADQLELGLAHGFRIVHAALHGVESRDELTAVLIVGSSEGGHHGPSAGPLPHVGQVAEAHVAVDRSLIPPPGQSCPDR
jgi:hypothetical protein